MSQVSQPRLRQRAVVVMGASVLTSLLLVAPAFAGDVHLSGLSSAPTHKQFIVKFPPSTPSSTTATCPSFRATSDHGSVTKACSEST